jgi:hypothetical protein
MRKTILVVVLALLAVPAMAQVSTRTDSGFIYDPEAQGPPSEDGSDNCPPSVTIAPLPFNDTGDTCNGFTNTVTSYTGTCTLPFPYGGEDQVYALNLGGGNLIDLSMDLTGSLGDLVLFIIGTCGDGTSCIANSQDAIGPGAGPEVIDAFSAAPGNYFLYVDSYYNAGTPGSCGTFTLDVTGTLPAELITFDVG